MIITTLRERSRTTYSLVSCYQTQDPVPLRDTLLGCTSTGLYSLMISLPRGRNQTRLHTTLLPMFVIEGLPSLPTCTSLCVVCQATRELLRRCLVGLSLAVSQALAHLPLVCPLRCTECWHIRPSSCCHWLMVCCLHWGFLFWSLVVRPYPGAQPMGSAGCTRNSPNFCLSAENICWITDTGEFHVLSHRKFSGLQSWLQIAPGNNSEYIFAWNISMGKAELLHMIWGFIFFFFAEDFVTKLN